MTNPLRPYYVPPSIGLPPSQTANADSVNRVAATASSRTTIRGSARDLLSDLDYTDYLESSPSLSEWLRELRDRALWKYVNVWTAQPFDVAKTLLQVYVLEVNNGQTVPGDRRKSQAFRESYVEEDPLSSEEDDGGSYFTSPTSSTPRARKSERHITDREGYVLPPAEPSKHRLWIKNPSSLTEVLLQLWSTSGPTSLWKASNATFIYSLLLPTLNTFIRSLLSAILGLPDEGTAASMTTDILTASSPSTILILSFISSALSAILLAPIDTARTFLIVTPLTHGPRSLLRAIRLLPPPSYLISPHLVPITILHSSLPTLLNIGTPLLLKSYFAVDPVLNPSSWSLFTFAASCLELGIRFPLETVLRRAQIAAFTCPGLRRRSLLVSNSASASQKSSTGGRIEAPDVETILPTPRIYRGIVGTMWSIVYEEGVSPSPSEMERAHELLGKPVPTGQRRRRQGQGLQGLYRGWKIGTWGLAGIWGAGALGTAFGAGEDDYVTTAGSEIGLTGRARAF